MSFQNFTLGLTVFLFAQAVAQVESAKRNRCEEKVALQAELRTLKESQEMLHGEVADLKNALTSVSDIIASSLPEDCSAAKARGSWSTTSMVRPPGLSSRMVRCEQRDQDGGWTVILARRPTAHPLNFNATWQQYKDGFGDINGEFWIGNEVLHALTKEVPHHLRVVLRDWKDVTTTATWNSFTVNSEEYRYRLGISGYREDSTATNQLRRHDGHDFSTHDADNDKDPVHCAQSHGGGWWYFRCYTANPTGAILSSHQDADHGMVWGVGSQKINLKSIIMMIKPSQSASYSSFF